MLSQRTASHPKKRSHSIICNHSASQDIISPSKCRNWTSHPPLEVIQPLAHALVSCRKCNVMFRIVIVILLASLTKKHLRHTSDFTFLLLLFTLFGASAQLRQWVLVPEVINTSELRQMGRNHEEGLSGSGWTPMCLWCPLITEVRCHTGRSLGFP